MIKSWLNRSLIALLCCAVALPVYAEDINLLPHSYGSSKQLSLKEAIMLALRYNTSIQNSEINRISEKFALRDAAHQFEVNYDLSLSYNASQARANGLSSGTDNSNVNPTMSLNNHYGGNYSVSINNPTANGVFNPGVDLTIDQPLLRGFGKAVTMANYYNAVDSETNNKLSLKSTLISQVQGIISSYRQLIQNQNDVKTAVIGLKNYKETLKSDKALIRAGKKAPAAILQAEADYTSQQVQVENTKNQVITQKLSLINTIGLPPQINFVVPNDVTTLKKIKLNAKDCYHIALKNSPSYLQQILTVREDERNLLVAQDNMRMQLDAQLTASTGNGSGGGPNSGFVSLTNNNNTNLGIGFTLTVPIEDFDAKTSLISARTSLSEAKISLEQARRDLMNTIITDITNIISNYKQAMLSRESVKIAEKNQQRLNVLLKLGRKSTFEVNEQLKNLLSEQNSYIAAKITYLESVTQLYADMGILLDKYKIQVRY